MSASPMQRPEQSKSPTAAVAGSRVANDDDLEIVRRQQKALDLKIAGATYEQIAQQLGYSNRGNAHRAVQSLLARTDHQLATEYRDLQNARLERMFLGLWPAASVGDVQAVRAALAVEERRAKLLGLDAPQGYLIAVAEAADNSVRDEETGQTVVAKAMDAERLAEILAMLNPGIADDIIEGDVVVADGSTVIERHDSLREESA